MINRQKLFSTIATISAFTLNLPAMEFDFRPLASLCRVEVNLATGFGSGAIRGTFGQMDGKMNFSPEYPENSSGKIVLNSRSLRFGYPIVAYETHIPEWLHSSRHPVISFTLEKLQDFAWHKKELRTDAFGVLQIKGIEKSLRIPLSIRYFRGQRRKYEGKAGDLIRLEGMLVLPRSQFGLAPGKFMEIVREDITVRMSITGASNRVRPFLPSRLFGG
ncbi:YceI family protein [Opitutales bacterium]|jgi:polyisoprenoid-binding protein YceI|nr:YceI family protein [Opitutales bacterium]